MYSMHTKISSSTAVIWAIEVASGKFSSMVLDTFWEKAGLFKFLSTVMVAVAVAVAPPPSVATMWTWEKLFKVAY